MGPRSIEKFQKIAFSKIKQNAAIQTLLDFSYDNNLAAAAWRLPGETEKHLIVDLSGEFKRVKTDLEELDEGFIFAPFDNPQNQQSIFVRADFHYSSAQRKLQLDPRYDGTENPGLDLDPLFDSLSDPDRLPESAAHYYINRDYRASGTDQKTYEGWVKQALEAIHAEEFHKVVPCRTKCIQLGAKFDLVKNFLALCKAYPNAFISVVSVPGLGTWMGATPEALISMDKHKIFRTASLAGTQLYDPAKPLPQVAWTQKEIEEQAMVSRFIINCFKKIRLREFEEIGPRTSKAANLVHLKTDYLVDTKEVNFPQLGTVMLELLHPTSAVCGMPRQSALDFIKRTENFDRAFYTGYLGPVNLGEESHLFVNLRCMQLLAGEAVLYAGAGIIADSEPEMEWQETEIKCDTLLNVIRP